MKKLFRFETFIFFSIWLVLMMRGPSNLFRDPGTFFHTKLGEYILTYGQLPQRDIFSFTVEGKSWVAHQWLGECIMGFIHRMMGLDGLLLATATLLAALFAWMAHRLHRSGLHFMLSALIISFSFAASAVHLHIRPHIVSILFMAIVFARLSDFEAGRLNFHGLLWLLPIFIIWTNIHGGVLGGLATLAILIGGWTLAKMLGLESPLHTYRETLLLWGFLLLCTSTVFINPYGLDLPKTWFSIMNSQIIPSVIQEHASAFRGQSGWIIFPLGFFFILAFIGIFPKTPRISWCIPFIWFALALSRIRHAPLFAVVAAIALTDIFPHVGWAKKLASRGSQIFSLDYSPPKRNFFFQLRIPSILIMIVIFLHLVSIKIPVLGKDWAKLDTKYWPVDLLPQLQALQNNESEGKPIFNDYIFGGFLIYYTPGLRVFIDDRCELYGDQALLEYVNANCSQVEDWGEKYAFDLALTESGSIFDGCLNNSENWMVVGKTNRATLFRKLD